VPLVRPARVVECDMAPVVENMVPFENVNAELVEYRQVAASLVVAVMVACVVPDGSEDTGPVMFTVGGVVSTGAVTVTEADCVTEPPVPEHVSVYVWFAVRLVKVCEPLAALLPDQLPEAVQLVALVEDHVRIELPPEVTEVGAALIVIVGTGASVVTFTLLDAAERFPAASMAFTV